MPVTAYAVFDAPVSAGSRYKGLALQNLWRSVANSLVVRHPDPKTRVRVEVAYEWGTVFITFYMHNIADTCNPDRRIESFRHPCRAMGWPGRRAAELYILAAWMLYLQHEATELVLRKADVRPTVGELAPDPKQRFFFDATRREDPYHDRSRVLDVHGSSEGMREEHWRQMNWVQIEGSIPAALTHLIGRVQATALLDGSKAAADRELANEIAALTGGEAQLIQQEPAP